MRAAGGGLWFSLGWLGGYWSPARRKQSWVGPALLGVIGPLFAALMAALGAKQARQRG